MSKNKTVETQASVDAFLRKISDAKKREDFRTIVELITKHTKLEPKMWGTSIVGFGSYHYKYESGREGDSALVGMASRANAITFYVGSEFKDREKLLASLGKHKESGGCVHIQKLDDIDTGVLMKVVKNAMEHRRKAHS